MIYKGKQYDDNQTIEIFNNRDNDILTYTDKLDSVQAKIAAYENDITTKDKTINELKIKNYDLLTKVTVGVPQEPEQEDQPKLISINDLM